MCSSWYKFIVTLLAFLYLLNSLLRIRMRRILGLLVGIRAFAIPLATPYRTSFATRFSIRENSSTRVVLHWLAGDQTILHMFPRNTWAKNPWEVGEKKTGLPKNNCTILIDYPFELNAVHGAKNHSSPRATICSHFLNVLFDCLHFRLTVAASLVMVLCKEVWFYVSYTIQHEKLLLLLLYSHASKLCFRLMYNL